MNEVSVVIPAWNAAATLDCALDSAVSEPAVGEIVVVDDGSHDATFWLAARRGRKVRALTGPRLGVSAARNRGVAATHGEWLLFLDADDMLTKGTVALRLAAGAEADVVFAAWREQTGPEALGGERSVDAVALREDAERAILAGLWAPPAALLYRRALVEAAGGFCERFPVIQDARLLFDAARLRARFAHSDHVGAHYRVAASGLSRRDPGRFWRDAFRNAVEIEALWRVGGEPPRGRAQALAAVYDAAARGLFSAGDDAFFPAVAHARSCGPLTRRVRVAAPLARAVGLQAARRIFAMTGAR